MGQHTRRSVLFAAAAASLSACAPAPGAREAHGQQLNSTSRLGGMTLEQKVGQLFIAPVHGSDPHRPHPRNRAEYGVDTPAEVVQRHHLGGIIHFGWTDSLHDPEQIAALSRGLQEAAVSSGPRLPLLISTDQEGGAITRIGAPATEFPGSMALGAARDPRAAERAAAITGQELRAMGLNLDFAPSGDVNVNPANPIIGVRSFSSDPQLAAQLTAAQVRGYQSSAPPERTVSAAVKHFPGHGDTAQDSHEGLPVIRHTREQWEQVDAPPFRAARDADMIMSGHLVVPELDGSHEPATLSPRVLTGMLRGELGYRGVICTDSLRMEGVRTRHPDAEVPVLALLAGADQMLMPVDFRAAVDGVVRAVRSGRLSERRIDESLDRILRMKSGRGLFAHPRGAGGLGEVGAPAHRAEAQRITDRTTTLLRNDESLLPLRTRPARVLVTGAGDDATAALAASVRARGPRTTALATGSTPAPDKISGAVQAGGQHDVVVVLTNSAWKESRAAQRDLVRALVQAGSRVVAVAVRDPYDAGHVEEARTWLATYSDKAVAMESLARVLFGETAPAGKLPVAVPDPARAGAQRYPYGHGLSW